MIPFLRYFLLLCLSLGWYACSEINKTIPTGKDKVPLSSFKNESPSFNNTAFAQLKDTQSVNQQIKYASDLWLNKPDSAKILLTNAARASHILHFYQGIINALGPIVNYYTLKNQPDSILFYCKIMLPAAQKLPPPFCTIEAIYSTMGVQYYSQAKFDSSFTYLYKSLNQLRTHDIDPTNGWRNAYHIYNVGGVMWLNFGEPETALPYLKKAEEMAVLLKDSAKLMEIIHNKATVYFRREIWDSAFMLYKSVLTNPATPAKTKIQASHNLANLYVKNDNKYHNPDSALFYANEALILRRKLNGPGSQEENLDLYMLSCVYGFKAYDSKDSSYYVKAEETLSKMDSKKLGTIIRAGELVNLYKNRAAFAAVNHRQYQKAYGLMIQAFKIHDSLYNIEKRAQKNRIDVRYRIAEKDKEIAQTQLRLTASDKKVADKNNLILSIGFGATLALMLLSWRYLYIRQKNRKLESDRTLDRLNAKIEGEEQEKTRIAHDLHDSVNSHLAGTQSYLIALQQKYPFLGQENEFTRIVQTLSKTSEEVRQIAHNLVPGELMLKRLPVAIHDFCSDLFTPRNIPCDLQVLGNFEEVPMDMALTLYRMVQELSQNIIKHAEATEVIIMLNNQEDQISLLVEDNGKGITSDASKAGHPGMGLQGLQERVLAKKGTLNIETRKDYGTTVHIIFPNPPPVKNLVAPFETIY